MDKDSMFPRRLQAYMAKCGVASRRGSEELIAQGRAHQRRQGHGK